MHYMVPLTSPLGWMNIHNHIQILTMPLIYSHNKGPLSRRYLHDANICPLPGKKDLGKFIDVINYITYDQHYLRKIIYEKRLHMKIQQQRQIGPLMNHTTPTEILWGISNLHVTEMTYIKLKNSSVLNWQVTNAVQRDRPLTDSTLNSQLFALQLSCSTNYYLIRLGMLLS